MKTRRCHLMTFMILVTLIISSCTDPDVEPKVDEAPVFDASRMNERIYVGRDSVITINNMDSGKMYAVRNSGSSSRNLDDTGDTDSKVGVFNENTYVPVPDADGTSTFKASSVGISDKGYLELVELKIGDDHRVSEDDDHFSYYTSRQFPVYEEFYHIDFKKLGLDPKKVVITPDLRGSGSGSSNWGYVTINESGISKHFNGGYHDFSGKDFINVYNSITCYRPIPDFGFSDAWSQRLVICNPIVMECDEPVVVTDDFMVLSIPAGSVDYVLEYNGVGSVYDMYTRNAADGISVPQFVSMERKENSEKFYIGKVEEEMLVDIKLSVSGGSLKLRAATAAEIEDFAANHCIVLDGKEKTVSYTGKPFHEVRLIGNELTDYRIHYEVMNSDGSYYQDEISHIYFDLRHLNGKGNSGRLCYGPYVDFVMNGYDVLDKITFDPIPEGVTGTITFIPETAVEEDEYWLHVICPDKVHSQKFTEMGSSVTVPAVDPEGREIDGMWFDGKVYGVGESMELMTQSTAVIPVVSMKTGGRYPVEEGEHTYKFSNGDTSKIYVLDIDKKSQSFYNSTFPIRKLDKGKLVLPVQIECTPSRNVYYIGSLPESFEMYFWGSSAEDSFIIREVNEAENAAMKSHNLRIHNYPLTATFTVTYDLLNANPGFLSYALMIVDDSGRKLQKLTATCKPGDNPEGESMDVSLTLGYLTDKGRSSYSKTLKPTGNEGIVENIPTDALLSQIVLEVEKPIVGSTVTMIFDC